MGKNYKGITFKIVFQKKKREYKENEASNASNSTKSEKKPRKIRIETAKLNQLS